MLTREKYGAQHHVVEDSGTSYVWTRQTLFLYEVPALFTRQSTLPYSPIALPTTDFQSSELVTFNLRNTIRWGISAATFWPSSSLMSQTSTLAPSLAKRRAIAAPNPELAPVVEAKDH